MSKSKKRIVITSSKDIKKFFKKELRREERLLWSKQEKLGTAYWRKYWENKEARPWSKFKKYVFRGVLFFAMLYYLWSDIVQGNLNTLIGWTIVFITVAFLSKGLYQMGIKIYGKELIYLAITTQRVFIINDENGLKKESEMSAFTKAEIKVIEGKQRLVFKVSNEEDFIMPGTYDANKLFKLVYPHWQAASPIGQHEKTIAELSKKYRLKHATDIEKHTLTGEYNGRDIKLSWKANFPVRTIQLDLLSPNPTGSYLSFTPEKTKAKLKLLLGQKEHLTNDEGFDNTFLLVADNKDLINGLLDSSDLRAAMKACQTIADCSWTFGTKKENSDQRNSPVKSTYSDDEEILDLQLIDLQATEAGIDEKVKWQPDLESQLEFVAKLDSKARSSPEIIDKVLNKCLESTLQILDGLDRYHKRVG